MKVVSDTSPIGHLVLIGKEQLLPALFGSVLIPEDVRRELSDERAPAAIRQWLTHAPRWLEVHNRPGGPVETGARPRGSLEKLHSGEQAAILLAEEVRADLVLLDERAGRKVAMERGQRVAGLVGVLDLAAARGLVDFHATLRDLLATGFRLSPKLVKHFLSRRS